MKLKKFIKQIDTIFSIYLGLKEEIVYPKNVYITNNQLLITFTSSCKRHFEKESFERYSIHSIKQTSVENKVKLGIAVGQAIAKNLVVSFEAPFIHEGSNSKN
jgi:hypothetical protein